jgi:hypothetical protein
MDSKLKMIRNEAATDLDHGILYSDRDSNWIFPVQKRRTLPLEGPTYSVGRCWRVRRVMMIMVMTMTTGKSLTCLPSQFAISFINFAGSCCLPPSPTVSYRLLLSPTVCHPLLLSPTACYCLPPSASLSYCLLPPVTVSHGLPPSATLSYCVLPSATLSCCLLPPATVSHRLLLSPTVSYCTLLSPTVCYCLLLSPDMTVI